VIVYDDGKVEEMPGGIRGTQYLIIYFHLKEMGLIPEILKHGEYSRI